MKRIDAALLREMATRMTDEEAAEMAIPSYLHSNPVMRETAWARVHLLARRLRALCGSRRIGRILDYGCGAGVLLAEAASCADEVIGVDLVTAGAELLVERRRLPNVRVLTPEQAEAIEPGTVDVIVAGEVLEHVEPLEPTARWLAERLRPDGTLLVSLPTENALYRLGRRLAGFSGHYHHDDAASIDRGLRATGFGRRRRRSFPLPGPLAIYWIAEYAPPRR